MANFCECESQDHCDKVHVCCGTLATFVVASYRQTLCEQCAMLAQVYCSANGYEFVRIHDVKVTGEAPASVQQVDYTEILEKVTYYAPMPVWPYRISSSGHITAPATCTAGCSCHGVSLQ